ncbi:MAG TPA: histidine kinase, partial [Candidatus Acidoferrales bacterium]|nr:histidine kinase [Candidatus Acidoferrales bacterium]
MANVETRILFTPMQTLTSGKDLLFLLVLKVGLAASMAALLARSATFRKVLYTEMRNSDEKMQLLLFMAPTLVLGVLLRLVGGFRFADLSLEGSFLLGILGGSVAGSIGGAIVSLPAFFNHEWIATPLAVLAGAIGGLIRALLPNRELIWNFGPFLFLGIPRWIFRVTRNVRAAWEMLPLAAVIALELGRDALAHATFGRAVQPNWLFVLEAPGRWTLPLEVLAAVMAVAVPIKIWNNTRIEARLKQNEELLLQARMAALSSQINPHFMFNTLNTVTSLIRYDPELARHVVRKLSSILRHLLRKQENFVSLREELGFVDDYLDIEVARFGPDKIQIAKELDEDTLEAYVPSMLLQPIVENSIKHGLAPKVDGGQIRIRTARR